MGKSAKSAAVLLLGAGLAACAGSDDSRNISYTDDRSGANQPYPNDYRPQLLAFLKTYLNNPVGVRDAGIADPAQRTVGGRLRYVSCLRFSTRFPTAIIVTRASAPPSMSTAGWTMWWRKPARSAPDPAMRHSRSWKS